VAAGGDGLLEGVTPGAVYVDLSTNSPTVVKRIAERFESAGAHMVDAPVSGGPMGAEAGTLSVMVGGAPEIVERIRPVLEVLGVVSYAGPVGSGTVAKLVHNAITMTTRIVVQDGMALATKAGVEPELMLEILKNASFGKQLMLTTHIPDLVFKGDYDHPRFSLALANKDVTLALEMAKEIDAPMPLVEQAHQVMKEAMERGWADKDSIVTFRLAEERTGVRIRSKEGRP
jgi:3-hydroxyisobutyrate dehydrogenase